MKLFVVALFILAYSGPAIFEAITDSLEAVSQEAWGLILTFIGAVYYASEDDNLSIKRKAMATIFGVIFGFSLGYGAQKQFGLEGWSYFVYAMAGVLGFNVAGGFKTIGTKFRKNPLKTAEEINRLRRQITDPSDDEKSNDNDNEHPNGSGGSPN